GLRIEASEVRDRLGFAEPAAGAEILTATLPCAPPAVSATEGAGRNGSIERISAVFKRGSVLPGVSTAETTSRHSAGEISGGRVAAGMVDQLGLEAG
ncbi:hypothetical protein, partial [Streptomyces sp. P17]|uniref:hypothetical protein n=1 Tax=Streptomyces sp. P17 TaxID=3074716 RepID=UPI0028F45800